VNRLFRWGIIIALLVLVASSLMAVRIIFVDDDEVDVPPIVGLSAVEATNRLQNSGLTARIDIIDSDQPEGVVISQTPGTGEKTEKGKIVVIRVSRGGTQLRIPDVRGMEFAAAVKALDTAGFKIGTVLRVTDQLKPSGTVIAQNPASPSMVLSDRMVELLVSEGAAGRTEMVQIPDLKGQSEKLARQILEQSSLSVSRTIVVESNQVPDGSVLRTQPIAGSRVPPGNAIILYLAKETDVPPPTTPEVSHRPPNVIQTTPADSPGAVLDAPVAPAAPSEVQQPVIERPSAETPQQPVTPPPATPAKIAKIRYQVPPLTRPLSFKITIDDDRGTRVLREQQARGGEYITMDIGYAGSAAVTVQLDGETVWQEKYR
jgi:serine/threonine-protein kinase